MLQNKSIMKNVKYSQGILFHIRIRNSIQYSMPWEYFFVRIALGEGAGRTLQEVRGWRLVRVAVIA